MTQHHPTTRTIITTTLLATTLPLTTATPAAADPPPTAWTQLRACESGDNYTVIAVDGHYGAYQFDLPTWHSVGGTGRPDQATPTEQDYRALYLYRMRGWQPWTCATTLHLPADADAASQRIPTYADVTHIHPNPTTTTPNP
jgi:resuscitation-promoting factor RpfA